MSDGTSDALSFKQAFAEAARACDPDLVEAQRLAARVKAAVSAARSIPGVTIDEILAGAFLSTFQAGIYRDRESHERAVSMAWGTAREQAAKALEAQAVALRKLPVPR